ncbi:MAG: hypothetical protein HYS33_01305 [Acidobacteria bacterium]|nr:hypothetical protein [Acidobacteriota bacterium]
MAVVRTVLPRKGIIQPRHGDNYEADLDTNWLVIDSLLQDAADVEAAVTAAGTVEAWLQDRGLSGVLSGLDLGGSTDLTPALSAGVLYAQGLRYAPQNPDPGPAPASTTSHLWYNSSTGFYYNLSGTPATTGDAFLGSVVTDATRVLTVTPAAKMYGQVSATAPAPGNFSLAHNFGRAPLGALIYMTSGGALWFQSPTMFDATNLYLVASAAEVTAKVQIW